VRVLLTGLGTATYRPVAYAFDGRSCDTAFAPLAAARIAGDGPLDRIITITTAEAWRKNGKLFSQAAEGFGLPRPDLVEISAEGGADLVATFRKLHAAVPRDAALHIDVTYAFRYLPFTFFGIAAYLRATRNVGIERVTYGFDDGRILDVTWLVELADWADAARALGDGDARPFARLLGERKRRDGRLWPAALDALGPALERATSALATGLPIELALETNPFAHAPVGEALERTVPLARDLFESAARRFGEILGAARQGKGRPEKERVPLDDAFLAHEAKVVEALLACGDLDGASRVAEEWLVDRVLARRGVREPARWLKREERMRAEAIVSGASFRFEMKLSDASLGRLVHEVKEIRNLLAHAGHDPKTIDLARIRDRLARAWSEIGALPEEAWDLAPASAPVAVVTPLGLSRGVLYTLLAGLLPILRRESPVPIIAEVQVVTSQDGLAGAREAYERARERLRAGEPVIELPPGPRLLAVSDPVDGFEKTALAGFEEACASLLSVKRVIANTAGGSAAIQAQTERLLERARRLGIEILRVATVDRRPPEEQKRDPYGGGELVEIS
jgi:hypothetical protein